uniref:NADH-ubiquinone oxidoreductase chain 2 n=1 Tax=Hylarana malayana TaxID=3366710 RepID=A0A343VYN3_9NEOB|nr:NADH dehydrogenase subunit 2 [Sylvirana malayana]AVP82529.1 NADH dehydrogenase subunit 2 [Sylvirana malayana]AVP82530.1 NADH dehydrogenase subunit 2 [Sylvirana malayana]AVP82531.1 NADH dehydrogenase subunit 2 [Sylvirana malayana]AVP82532.1 NADH dehydrogenase subunit 2 [Sylvirana malayana]
MPSMTLTYVLLSLALGTAITLSADHWILAWAGLEINTLALIPLMTLKSHPRAIEAALKYFLTQATASALILFSTLINACYTGQWYIQSLEDIPTIALTIALMMKLGLVPTHLWMPEVIQGIPLSTGLILSTWQKLAPMALILQASHLMNLNLTIFLGLTSIVVAGWSGIGQTQLRKILAFSSIGHLGWTIIIVKFCPELALLNFLLYVIMTTAAFLTLISMNITKMTEFSTAFHKMPHLALLTTLILLSLAGLPPFTGFTPKLLIITSLISNNAILMAAVIMLTSMFSLFFYLRLTYLLTQITPPNILNSPSYWRITKNYHAVFTLINLLALMTFPLIPPLMLM